MPEMQAPPPDNAVEESGDQSQGGIAEALTKLDQQLMQVTQAVAQSGAPDAAKQAFGQALESFRAGLEALTSGGDQAGPQGAVTPEQGASGAKPLSMGAR